MVETKTSDLNIGPSYRHRIRTQALTVFPVRVKETDLLVYAQKDLTALTTDLVLKYRGHIEAFIKNHPEFVVSLSPLNIPEPVPRIIQDMLQAAKKAGVGPMAAVAGAIAQCVGMDILSLPDGSSEVIIENGGDIFIKAENPITVGLYAGESPLSFKIGLQIRSDTAPVAVCTSSGTVGHSLSFGKADAVCVVSESCPFADAVATAIGNLIRSDKDIPKGIEYGRQMKGVTGLVVVVGSKMGIWGELELVRI